MTQIVNEFSPFHLVKNLWAIQETLTSGGLSLRWLEMGLGSPDRDWTGSWRWKDQILAIRPVVRDKGSGPSALKKRISTKKESSEASEEFFRRKKSTLHVDTHTGRLRGRVPELLSHPSWQFELFLWGISSGFPLVNHFGLPYLAHLRVFPCVGTYHLDKTDFPKRVSV